MSIAKNNFNLFKEGWEASGPLQDTIIAANWYTSLSKALVTDIRLMAFVPSSPKIRNLLIMRVPY
jgi:hypothetical protein